MSLKYSFRPIIPRLLRLGVPSPCELLKSKPDEFLDLGVMKSLSFFVLKGLLVPLELPYLALYEWSPLADDLFSLPYSPY
jgi:hypothetical protein